MKAHSHTRMPMVVLTGGPGAGKTAILELAKKEFCQHVAFLPEAASIIFQGGFWRLPSASARMAQQRAIFHIQSEMEMMVQGERKWSAAFCDRGTLDGLAYWPETAELFFDSLKTTKQAEYQKYAAVIHLRTPNLENGYNHENPLRIESVLEARRIDQQIVQIWQDHPNYCQIESHPQFLDKVSDALAKMRILVPRCSDCEVGTG